MASSRSNGGSKGTFGANNPLNNATKYGTKGHIGTRHKPRMHISPHLTKQVRQIMSDKGTMGKRIEVWNDIFQMSIPIPVAKRWFKFGNTQNPIVGTHVFFTPRQIQNSAAIMFNKKLPTQDYTVVLGNFNRIPSTTNIIKDTDSIFDIKSQKVSYVFKNNTQRHYAFTVTVMTPRNNTDTTVSSTIDDAIATDVAQGRWAGNTVIGPSKENPVTVWQNCPTLKTYFKMETTLIKIDPGASFTHVIHGYSGRFNLKKSIKEDDSLGDTHWLYPKDDTKFVVFEVIPNLVAINESEDHAQKGYAGRWHNAFVLGSGILMEIRSEIVMDAPEIKPLNNNRYVEFQENYTNDATTVNRVVVSQNPDNEGDGLIIVD